MCLRSLYTPDGSDSAVCRSCGRLPSSYATGDHDCGVLLPESFCGAEENIGTGCTFCIDSDRDIGAPSPSKPVGALGAGVRWESTNHGLCLVPGKACLADSNAAGTSTSRSNAAYSSLENPVQIWSGTATPSGTLIVYATRENAWTSRLLWHDASTNSFTVRNAGFSSI